MRLNKSILPLLFCVILSACGSSPSENGELTISYVSISTAIEMSKESRLKFQDKFATALDSLSVNEVSSARLAEVKHLLVLAKMENDKAIALVAGTKEIDIALRYKEKALDMFRYMDDLYSYNYPSIFKIMEGSAENKKKLISNILVPSTDSLKIKATLVIETAKALVKKYDIKLFEVRN